MGKFISPLTSETLPDVAKIVARAYHKGEPLANHINKTIEEARFIQWVEKIGQAAIAAEDPFSCAVIDDESCKVIGGMIAFRMSNDIKKADSYPALQPIFDVLGKLTVPAYVKQADPSKVVNLELLGGLSPAEGGQKGIVDFLLLHTFDLANELGIRYVKFGLTSPVTQHVCLNKHGFKAEHEITFAASGVAQYKDLPGKAILGIYDMSTYKPK